MINVYQLEFIEKFKGFLIWLTIGDIHVTPCWLVIGVVCETIQCALEPIAGTLCVFDCEDTIVDLFLRYWKE